MSFHLVTGIQSVLITNEASKYTDDQGNKCSGTQLFNFYRNQRRNYTTHTKKLNRSGGPGPNRQPKEGPLIEKCVEVFAKDLRAIVRRDRANRTTSQTVNIVFQCHIISVFSASAIYL